MANKPVLGVAVCPFCGRNNPVAWNGNFKYPCQWCGKTFRIKRQKLKNVEPIKIPKGAECNE